MSRLLRRQKSIDYEFSERRSENASAPMCPSTIRRSRESKEKCCQIKMAAIYNDEDTIRCILKNETSIDSVQKLLSMRDERGQPCIFYALESRSCEALMCLLDHSKNTDCVIAANGESLLHVAARMGCVVILRNLLARDILVPLVDHTEKENGQAPLHIAAKYNSVEIVKELLLHGAKLDRQDSGGITPIFTAASKGNAAMLKVFLQHGAGRSVESLMLDSSLYGPSYESLFQVAVDNGDRKTVEVCLDQEPDIVCKCLREEMKQGVLVHYACKNGMEQCLLKIVEVMEYTDKMQLNKKDNLGFAPIHKAAINNHVRVVKYLCSICKSFVDQTTEHSQTALVLAAHRGHVKVVEELLKLEADFQISDDSKRTVLHYGVNFPDILRMLLKKKEIALSLLDAKEKDGYTTVHTAALKGLCESLKLLMDFGAQMDIFTNTSRSPLHCAVTSQCINVVELVLTHDKSLVNKTDATGKTPLHTAAYYGGADVVKCLLDHGALITSDGNLNSPLHIAAYKGHLDVVEILLAFDSNIIDIKNKYGRTALIEAASSGKTDVVKFLLENGASITQDHEFLNCLDWCFIKNDKDSAMVMMLDTRWNKILTTTKHGSEGTLAKLVIKMPEVANRVLSNSVTSQGHPDSQEHVKRYDFLCLQDSAQVDKSSQMKPMTAIEAMVKTQCYGSLCHPVCRKFLKAKWMEFGWRVHTISLLLYLIFLVALNIYAIQIPRYQETQANPDMDYDASFDVKGSMVICLIFAGVNVLKEIMQLIFYRHRYFFDPVNYMEWVLYVCVFIFATPKNQKIAVKTSLQWKSCSVALFLAWINLVLYLRRFASYGIYVLMMRKICITLFKVLSLLIFFFVAFAAAFLPIMNDKPGFTNFGLSMLSSAVMTTGEFDFKETFLDEANHEYATFYWLRLGLLVVFLILMPVILMNLLLALAIGDTNSIMQQAKLKKHIQTAKIIIDLERKRHALPLCFRSKISMTSLEERPNKRVHFLRRIWEYLCYGPEFTSDEDTRAQQDKPRMNENVDARLVMIIDMMKQMQDQMIEMQQKLAEKEGDVSLHKNSGRDTKEKHKLAEGRRKQRTPSGGKRTSSEESATGSDEQKVWPKIKPAGTPNKFHKRREIDVPETDSGEDFVAEEQDVEEDEDREKHEKNPELIELKELHKRTPTEDCTSLCDEEDDIEGWNMLV